MKNKLNWCPSNWIRNVVAIAAECGGVGLFWLRRHNRYHSEVRNSVLLEALGGQPSRSDIADHLNTIFFFSCATKNQLIVELGTRGGESTRALLAGASISNAHLLSVDIDDCSGIPVPFSERWSFVRVSDVDFGATGFVEWCRAHGLEPEVDLLFIDTSHEYRHTVEELRVWIPHLSDDGVVLLHDTNMGNGSYARMHGALGAGWDNERGVIRAVEEKLGTNYDERRFFGDVAGGFRILHFPWSNGLTVLQKQKV